MSINNLEQTHVKLYREVNKKIRYYFIDIYKNLFDEYIIQSRYGSTKYKSHTGVNVSYFKELDQAIKAMKALIVKKHKRGYKPLK